MFYQLGKEWDLSIKGVIVTISSRILAIYRTPYEEYKTAKTVKQNFVC